jgi:hypothetical protein
MKALRSLLLISTLALPLIAATARAQETTPGPMQPAPLPYAPYVDPTVSLELTGNEPITVSVYFEAQKDERPIFRCQTPCRVRLYPSTYRFHLRGGPDKVEADTVVDVDRPQRLTFTLPAQADKTEGLAVAITGTALIPAGAIVAMASALSNACFDCEYSAHRDQSTPAGVYVGLTMLAVGAVLTPVGWVTFARNRKPHYESAAPGEARARPKRSPEPTPVGFGVAPTKGGASAGIWGTF